MKSVRFTAAICFSVVVVASATISVAQETQPAKPCTSFEYLQFDFWVGNWRVADEEGNFQGTNRVEKVFNGCAIQENWEGAQGTRGSSFNIYAKHREEWHQTWVDTNGMLLLLDGGIEDGKMVLRGKTPTPDGNASVEHEISWRPMPDGRVVQQWRTSLDGGENWRHVFVGIYTKQK